MDFWSVRPDAMNTPRQYYTVALQRSSQADSGSVKAALAVFFIVQFDSFDVELTSINATCTGTS
jgi:hypothetical protein